jgi:hypothetical protein
MAMEDNLFVKFGEWFVAALPWIMGGVFLVGCMLRYFINYTVGRHEWFAREFEKRVHSFMETQVPGQVNGVSFYSVTKRLLEKTYYEVFEIREKFRRRRWDSIMHWQDRVFLVKQGCAWLIKDILKQVKFLKWTNETPKLLHITKATLHHNPCFNKVFGFLPLSTTNDIVGVMPGLFVVAGILGTFIGIAKGLPALGNMNMADMETTKLVMDGFLKEIAFAMHSSIFGIAFSLTMHIYNTYYSPERTYVSMVDRFESSMDLLWYRSDNNNFPVQGIEFDEHKDPSEALAEEAIRLEVEKNPRGRDLEEVQKGKKAS